MCKPKFFQAVLQEVEGDVLDHVYPHFKGTRFQMNLTERMGSEDAKCPECEANSWIILPKESPAVAIGGKPFIECMDCGYSTHL